MFSVWVPMAWVMASTVTEPRSAGVLSPAPSPSRLVTTFDVAASMERSTVANVIEPMATSLPLIVWVALVGWILSIASLLVSFSMFAS